MGKVLDGLGTTLKAMPTTVISCESLTVERDIVQAPQTSRGSQGSWAGKDSVLGREPGTVLVLVKP